MTAKKKKLKTSSKAAALVERISANAKNQSIVTTASDMSKTYKYIDFFNAAQNYPCIALEWLLGCKGLLAGRVLQLRAKYSKGKSSFMYYMYAAAQRNAGAYCFHVETEGAIAPPDYIYSFGCDPDELVIAEHNSLENCFESIDEIIATIRGGFGGSKSAATGRWSKTKYDNPLDAQMEYPIVLGIDSFSALGLDDQVREDVADLTSTPGLAAHSRKVRDYLRRRTQRFKQVQALCMLTSHETASINTGGGMGGPKKSALAQEAIGIHATYIIDVTASPWKDKDTGERIGDIITLKTEKNKMAPRYRQVQLYLRWNYGFDTIKTDTEFLTKHTASPVAEGSKRHSHGIVCPAVMGDQYAKSEQDFIEAYYGNEDLVMANREALRIRGYGFDFEEKYKSIADIEAETEAEIAATEDSDGA